MVELQGQYPNLELLRQPNGSLEVRGRISFVRQHDSRTVIASYEVRIEIPNNYPDSPPSAYETGGEIDKEFGHFMDDGSLCLGTPVEVRRRFSRDRTLLRFVEDQLISYLFNYRYLRQYGELPYGELSHGARGLLEYYNEFFGTKTVKTLNLLSCLACSWGPRRKKCPCGSRKKLKACHGPLLKKLRPHAPRRSFQCDLEALLRVAREDGVAISRRLLFPERSRAKRRRHRGRVKHRR